MPSFPLLTKLLNYEKKRFLFLPSYMTKIQQKSVNGCQMRLRKVKV